MEPKTKINYKTVTEDYNSKYGTNYIVAYVSKIGRGTLESKDFRQRIEKLITDPSGNIKKRYLIYDYKDISKSLCNKYSPSDIKRVLTGKLSWATLWDEIMDFFSKIDKELI